MGSHDLDQAGARTHREPQLVFEICDCVKGIAVELMDRRQVSIGREDTDAAREATEKAARRSVLWCSGTYTGWSRTNAVEDHLVR